jgi:predicted nuclease of predicted toxin-antitoxin system
LIIWIDAQLSPALAPWITKQFGIDAASLRYLGFVRAIDPDVFTAARNAGAVVMTKDADFVVLLERFGPPPHVLWVRCGNTSNAHMREMLIETLPSALSLIEAGEALVEITDIPKGRPPTLTS